MEKMKETKEETFLLVSLEDNKAQKLAQVISNDSCRKILDLLAKKTSTETEIAKELGIPISTAHYNIKHLLESRLIQADEFHYSEKGKEVLHYSISKKFIIIAPRNSEGILDKIKALLPIFLIVFAASAIIHFLQSFRHAGSAQMLTSLKSTETAASASIPNAIAASPQLMGAAQAAPPVALWFLYGALFALITVLAFDALRRKRKNSQNK